MELPLGDIRVIDLTVARAGPTCVRQLAGWSADVPRPEIPADREVMLRLVDSADVLIENMRPPVKHCLGFDYDTVHARNPRPPTRRGGPAGWWPASSCRRSGCHRGR